MPRRYFAKYMRESKHYSWHHYGETPEGKLENKIFVFLSKLFRRK